MATLLDEYIYAMFMSLQRVLLDCIFLTFWKPQNNWVFWFLILEICYSLTWENVWLETYIFIIYSLGQTISQEVIFVVKCSWKFITLISSSWRMFGTKNHQSSLEALGISKETNSCESRPSSFQLAPLLLLRDSGLIYLYLPKCLKNSGEF